MVSLKRWKIEGEGGANNQLARKFQVADISAFYRIILAGLPELYRVIQL